MHVTPSKKKQCEQNNVNKLQRFVVAIFYKLYIIIYLVLYQGIYSGLCDQLYAREVSKTGTANQNFLSEIAQMKFKAIKH